MSICVDINGERLKEQDSLQLLFVERDTKSEISFPLIENTKRFFYEAKIDLVFYRDFFVKHLFWDVYISYTDGEEIKKKRLLSNDQEIELLYEYYKELDKLIIPYTTNKGNFSLKIKEDAFITKIDQAYLTNMGNLHIEGYAVYPKENNIISQSVLTKTIIFRKGKDENIEELRFLAKNVGRQDLTEEYGKQLERDFDCSGFQIDIPLEEIYQLNTEKSLYKLYIEFSSVVDGIEMVRESSAIKFFPTISKYHSDPLIVKVKNKKKKIELKRTKKVRNFILKIDDYSTKKEIIKKVKKPWRNFRRSGKLKRIYKKCFKLIGKFPADKKLIMFESFAGKQFSCNPRAIYEYINANYPNYKLYWSIDKKYEKNFVNKDIKYIKRFSIKWLFYMARARYWVINSRLPLWIPKPKHTIYLQTWHGTPLKRLAADMDEVHMPGTTTAKYKRNFHRESAKWDYLVSPNAYSSEIFSRAFAFDKEMIESGYPRNDILYTDNNLEAIQDLKKRYEIPLDKKVILYAPTWRDDQFYGKGRYKFDLELNLKQLQEEVGDRYIVILRMHYLIAENFDLGPYEGFAYDFSNHEDIRELYLVSDILITDYSSVFFDYANLKRPMIFYVYDFESYRDKLRGFYFDFEKKAPGPLVKTTSEVIETIIDFEKSNFKLSDGFNEFYNKFCYLESGNSSEKVVKRILEKE